MKQKLLLYIFLIFLLGANFPQQLDAQNHRANAGVLSIDKSSSEKEIKLFPNPTSEYFQITNDELIEVISINNIVGKEVMRLKTQPNSMYDISSLQKGMYIVRLLDENGKAVKVVRLSKR